MPEEQKRLTVREAAKILGVSERRINQMIQEGVLKAEKHRYWKRWAIDPKDVDELRRLREF